MQFQHSILNNKQLLMTEITTLLTCLHPLLDSTTYRHLMIVSQTLLAMTGRITMLSISRWAGKGGSYRTIQRFFMTPITWDALNWAIIKASLSKELKVILVAGDATTVTKSGKETYGLGRFFSSIYSRAVPGIAFQTLSLIDVSQRKSWALLMEQILPKAKQQKSKKQTVKAKRGKGRPKGSKNKNHRNVKLNAEMMQVKAMLKKLLKRTKDTLLLVYFVYDGAFGNNAAVQMTRQVGLHLISKLRNDSALYFK
jgi:putative transposase